MNESIPMSEKKSCSWIAGLFSIPNVYHISVIEITIHDLICCSGNFTGKTLGLTIHRNKLFEQIIKGIEFCEIHSKSSLVAVMSGTDYTANHLLDGLVERAVEERQIVVGHDFALNSFAVLVLGVNPASVAGIF